MMLEKNYKEHMTCSKETKDLIMDQGVKDYLRHHPEDKGRNITQGFILRKLIDTYLKI